MEYFPDPRLDELDRADDERDAKINKLNMDKKTKEIEMNKQKKEARLAEKEK